VDVLELGVVAVQLVVDRPQRVEASGGPVDGDDPPGTVRGVRPGQQVEGDGDAGPAGAQAQDVPAGRAPVAGRHDLLERRATRDRVLGVAAEAAVALGEARHLAADLGVSVDLVEHVAAGLVEVDLVRRDERAGLGRIVLQAGDDLPVRVGIGVDRQVASDDRRAADAELLGPSGEDAHDRGLAGGHTDERQAPGHA